MKSAKLPRHPIAYLGLVLIAGSVATAFVLGARRFFGGVEASRLHALVAAETEPNAQLAVIAKLLELDRRDTVARDVLLRLSASPGAEKVLVRFDRLFAPDEHPGDPATLLLEARWLLARGQTTLARPRFEELRARTKLASADLRRLVRCCVVERDLDRAVALALATPQDDELRVDIVPALVEARHPLARPIASELALVARERQDVRTSEHLVAAVLAIDPPLASTLLGVAFVPSGSPAILDRYRAEAAQRTVELLAARIATTTTTQDARDLLAKIAPIDPWGSSYRIAEEPLRVVSSSADIACIVTRAR